LEFIQSLFYQLSAELLSVNGAVLAKSSHPCMLQFRSFPIRFARTFLMGIPLLLGISSETQKISIEILRHKEGRQRTEAIRVTLVPRAGTSSPPQLYEAQLFIHSQLPWAKQLVRNWKWTLYVWTSLYIYITFLLLLLFCCKPLIFPMTAANLSDRSERALTIEEPLEAEIEAKEEREVSELLRRWKRSRSKRKAIYLHESMPETIGSSTSSISLTREDTSTIVEDIGDSESVCLGG
jgi:seipin